MHKSGPLADKMGFFLAVMGEVPVDCEIVLDACPILFHTPDPPESFLTLAVPPQYFSVIITNYFAFPNIATEFSQLPCQWLECFIGVLTVPLDFADGGYVAGGAVDRVFAIVSEREIAARITL